MALSEIVRQVFVEVHQKMMLNDAYCRFQLSRIVQVKIRDRRRNS